MAGPPESPSGLVQCEVADGVATVTLNRPDAHNALNAAMRDELAVVLGWCAENTDTVRALVLAGAGKSFCSGQDLREGDAVEPAEGLERKLRGDFQTLLARSPQPTIAALHGHTLGRGLEVALTCDLRIAADDLQAGFPEVTLGMIPASGGSQRLPRLIGPARALHLLLTAERIDARKAYEWGLVTRVVPAADLAASTRELAAKITTHAPLALRFTRRAVLEGASLPLDAGLHLEAALAGILRTTEDRQEGARAFREKRPPRFVGR